ncbi:hypothetical protein BJV74DRAFT_885795 [Russula compacta]|nr:hypothetical protein BJV74DRAFT_885795 [Russula compacta]
MSSHNNSDSSLIPTNDLFALLNDAQTNDQTHPKTQHPSGSTQPPGAEIAGPPTSARLRQAECPVSGPLSPNYSEIEGGTNWIPAPFSANGQSHNSATNFDALSPPDSIPLSSHAFDLRAPFYSYADRIAMPGTQGNRPLTHMSKHSRHLSQPSIISSQAVAEVGEGALWALQLPPDQMTGHIHSSFPRRSSEPDSLRAADTERAFLAPYAPENQSTPATYTPFFGQPSFSQASPRAQYPTAASTHNVPESSPHTQDDLLAFLDSDGSFTPSCASDFQDDSISVTSFTQSASPGVPSELMDDALSQQGTSSVPPQSQLAQTQGRSGKRKRVAHPKDPRAAERLRSQRQTDDEAIMELWRLLVPKDTAMVSKKDRLRTSAPVLVPF